MLDRLRAGEHGPRPVADRLVSEDPVEEHPEAPLDDRVGDEQQMAAAELRRERYRKDVREFALSQIADVVVLADDEALSAALSVQVDPAVHLEDDGPVREREVGVRVRNRDHGLGAVWRAVHELAAVRPSRHERDHVCILAGLLEGALHGVPVARGDDHRLIDFTCPHELRQARDETLDGPGVDGLREQIVQLVVERADSLRHSHVLRNARQVASMFLGAVERIG